MMSIWFASGLTYTCLRTSRCRGRGQPRRWRSGAWCGAARGRCLALLLSRRCMSRLERAWCGCHCRGTVRVPLYSPAAAIVLTTRVQRTINRRVRRVVQRIPQCARLCACTAIWYFDKYSSDPIIDLMESYKNKNCYLSITVWRRRTSTSLLLHVMQEALHSNLLGPRWVEAFTPSHRRVILPV